MFKIDQVKSLLDCEQCHQLLVDPIATPCGYSVCKKHLDELLENSMEDNKFQCLLCQRQHIVPIEGFVINRRMQNALDIELNKFKPSQVYENCKRELNDAKDNVAKIEALENDPEYYIYEYFEEVKRQVDLRREEIKSRVDDCSDEMIRSIESSKENCVRLVKEGKRLEINVQKQKKVLDELLERFDRFDIDELKFDEIKQSVALFNKSLASKINEYKCSVVGNKVYSFETKDIDIENNFGSLKVVDKPFASSIMDCTRQKKLIELCEFPKDQRWQQIYKASIDGFKATDFHDNCDGIANTLTIIKSENGNIFGGYTEKEWHSRGGYLTDPSAFIFSLTNKDENSFKVVCSNDGQYAINCSADHGPVFGGDGKHLKDMVIRSDSNTLQKSYSNFGYSYQHPEFPRETNNAKSVLAGSHKFHIEEIEIYAKTDF